MNKNIKSVVGIIFHPENKKLVLGVSRKDDHTKMGLPGGKIDAGETPLEAIVREVKEETGLDVISTKDIYLGPCDGGKNSSRLQEDEAAIKVMAFECEVDPHQQFNSNESGLVRWVDWDEDLFKEPYGAYNKELYFSAKIYQKELIYSIREMSILE